MKTIIYISNLFFISLILLISSCDDSFLETSPRTEYADPDVWTDPAMVETFINHMYRRLDDPLTQRHTSVFVDEAHRRGATAFQNFNASIITPDNIGPWQSNRSLWYWDW